MRIPLELKKFSVAQIKPDVVGIQSLITGRIVQKVIEI